jgi:hypothetical protein
MEHPIVKVAIGPNTCRCTLLWTSVVARGPPHIARRPGLYPIPSDRAFISLLPQRGASTTDLGGRPRRCLSFFQIDRLLLRYTRVVISPGTALPPHVAHAVFPSPGLSRLASLVCGADKVQSSATVRYKNADVAAAQQFRAISTDMLRRLLRPPRADLEMEIIVDAKPEEQSIGWYYYLKEHLHCPSQARCMAECPTSPLRVGEVVDVRGMPADEVCEHAMFVNIAWQEGMLAVPLTQLVGVAVAKRSRRRSRRKSTTKLIRASARQQHSFA